MGRRGCAAVAVGAGAAAGAVLAAALTGTPVARADGVPSLPLPPFDLPADYFFPPGSPGTPTNVVDVIPGLYTTQDTRWSLPSGGDYLTRGGSFANVQYFQDTWDEVTQSNAADAPTVGTEWNNYDIDFPLLGALFHLVGNSDLSTPTGTADTFLLPLVGLTNDFYLGPAGLFDYLVFDSSDTAIPLLDLPVRASADAATGFGTLWPDLLATL